MNSLCGDQQFLLSTETATGKFMTTGITTKFTKDDFIPLVNFVVILCENLLIINFQSVVLPD